MKCFENQKVFKYKRYIKKMDNMDDPETNAKISDSAYSNSCSNSQSRRSHSSKSTHSGSNSSGSSGYGGKASTSGSSNILGQPPKKDKEAKKKNLSTEVKAADVAPAVEPAGPPDPAPIFAAPEEESINVAESTMVIALPVKTVEEMDTSMSEPITANEEAMNAIVPVNSGETYVASRSISSSGDGFSCVISMHDGVVMYTSASLTATLGFPKDIWIGRSFIEFLHPRDHKTFASLITNGLALPKTENGPKYSGQGLASGSTMVCRIRRYRSLNSGFGVKGLVVAFMPFMLKFFFKDYNEDDVKILYLVIQATPFFSAFKIPNESLPKPVPFVIRHAADGILEYIDPESVPYLGYLPQDIQDKNALHLYHSDDFSYLRQVYESIVKEGNVSSSRPYRLMTQNGDYVLVDTEWSSVINPWSMKLEFVIAKHHIVEGPANPDVFQSPEMEKAPRISEAEKYRIQAFRDSIIRVMNEVRTKPAEVAKQQMGKRCQDLASFMESLINELPKPEEELRVDIQEIQDRDHSNYERDSVMLGGISPHHDSDSKSSVETPLSYNQLNYNENLQRYFDSQQPHQNESIDMADGSNVLGARVIKPSSSKCYSPMGQNSGEINELSSNSSAVAIYVSSPGPPADDYQYMKLTEATIHKISRSALNRHNAEMEKELVKMHRESRSSKQDREKASNESRKNKKEHLARCNASFQPTSAGESSTIRVHRKDIARGVKRGSKAQYNDLHEQKHHCPSPREPLRRQFPTAPTQPSKPSVTRTATLASQWPSPQNVNSFNMFGVGMQQQMQMFAQLPAASVAPVMPMVARKPLVPGTSGGAMPGPSGLANTISLASMPGPSTTTAAAKPAMGPIQGTSGMQAMANAFGMPGMTGASAMPTMPVMTGMPVPYMVHGHPISMMYGQPFVYSPINPQMYPMQQSLMAQQTMECSNSLNLAASNYEQTSDFVASSSASQFGKSKNTSDENAERTDGESSYSSFYSSFFQTDSGSAEESGDQKNKFTKDAKNRFWTKNVQGDDAMSFQSSNEAMGSLSKTRCTNKLARRKMDAPWNEQVNLTSELIYKYQLVTKPMQEVLDADKNKIVNMEQPSLVNEQLRQLYLDMRLQGVAARLTLEEGITSSSSSGEETAPNSVKVKRKREFSKLAIIHEENAPFPAPGSGPLIPEGTPSECPTPTASSAAHTTTHFSQTQK